MTVLLSMTVPGVAETKGSWKIARGRLIPDNPREPTWAAAVGWAAKAQMLKRPITRDYVRVTISVRLPPPPNKTKKNRRDTDKLARSILDAMTGLVYVDDEQVDDLIIRRRRTDDAKAWGADILVESMGGS